MRATRFFRHLFIPHWWAVRAFSPALQRRIESAIGESERRHTGELRFVVEGPMPLSALRAGQGSRARAVDVFAVHRVWDTEHNSGVLIYVQTVDHKIEIVADRGIHSRVGQDFWEAVCRRLQASFRDGQFEAGALAAIGEITNALAEHFPPGADNPNELPDRPLML